MWAFPNVSGAVPSLSSTHVVIESPSLKTPTAGPAHLSVKSSYSLRALPLQLPVPFSSPAVVFCSISGSVVHWNKPGVSGFLRAVSPPAIVPGTSFPVSLQSVAEQSPVSAAPVPESSVPVSVVSEFPVPASVDHEGPPHLYVCRIKLVRWADFSDD